MLVFEGADDLGKTTAAKRLVELAACENMSPIGGPRFPIRYSHMSRPNKAFDFFNDYRDMISRYAVQDRFHLGGLVWHEGKISPGALRIIEGWLQAQGSLTVVLIARNEDWYKEHLEKGTEGKSQMFPTETILEGNRKFMKLVDDGVARVDYVCDISQYGFLSDKLLKQLLLDWTFRLGLLKEHVT